MRITKLHLILLFIVLIVGFFYYYQIQEKKLQRKEIALLAAAKEAETKRLEEEKRLKLELEKRKEMAAQAVSVAGEYMMIVEKEGKDIAAGQAALGIAKEKLSQNEYEKATEMAKQSIEEFKASPPAVIKYTVRRGDTLWKISKMQQHYGLGGKWTDIWRANEKRIKDFDILYPNQVLTIPRKKLVLD